tara:strand:+ start:1394 stop:1651 length:258 start_codon:yes stop_codon:yes gene_type:complete
MSYEHKANTGSVFKNDKRMNDSQPAYKGSGKIFGKEVWISGWINEKKDGEKYFGFQFQEKEESAPRNDTPPTQGAAVELDKEIPF